jgi:hypothetical protein
MIAHQSADGRMATAATRLEKNFVQRKNKRIDLTPTGLLMEGDSAQNPINECYGDFADTDFLGSPGATGTSADCGSDERGHPPNHSVEYAMNKRTIRILDELT